MTASGSLNFRAVGGPFFKGEALGCYSGPGVRCFLSGVKGNVHCLGHARLVRAISPAQSRPASALTGRGFFMLVPIAVTFRAHHWRSLPRLN